MKSRSGFRDFRENVFESFSDLVRKKEVSFGGFDPGEVGCEWREGKKTVLSCEKWVNDGGRWGVLRWVWGFATFPYLEQAVETKGAFFISNFFLCFFDR